MKPVRRWLDLIAGAEWVVTVHDGPLPAIDRLTEGMEGETRLGALESADFMASIVDSVIVGYYHTVEAFEREIDRLDEIALRGRPQDDVLGRLVDLRRRIGTVRQTLAPQREAFAPLARPDLAVTRSSAGRGPSCSRDSSAPSRPWSTCATRCSAPTTSTWVVSPSARTTS